MTHRPEDSCRVLYVDLLCPRDGNDPDPSTFLRSIGTASTVSLTYFTVVSSTHFESLGVCKMLVYKL